MSAERMRVERPDAAQLEFYRNWVDGNLRLPFQDRPRGEGLIWMAHLLAELDAVTRERDKAMEGIQEIGRISDLLTLITDAKSPDTPRLPVEVFGQLRRIAHTAGRVRNAVGEADVVPKPHGDAREDTARLDWLEEEVRDNAFDAEWPLTLSLDEASEGAARLFAIRGFRPNETGVTLRAAIDAAMESAHV